MGWLSHLLHKACQVEIEYLKKESSKAEEFFMRARLELEGRLTEKNAQLDRLNSKISQLEGEIGVMQMVMMPMSSAAGAAYSRAKFVKDHPGERTAATTGTSVERPKAVNTDWRTYLQEHKAEVEAQEAEETKDGSKGR